jgi:hypothetical protein
VTVPDSDLVCRLTATDYRDRQAAWHKVGNYVTASAAVPGGLRLSFAPALGLADSLTALVRLEGECCAWMAFAMSETSEAIGLTITSNAVDGDRAVREAFAGLARI